MSRPIRKVLCELAPVDARTLLERARERFPGNSDQPALRRYCEDVLQRHAMSMRTNDESSALSEEV